MKSFYRPEQARFLVQRQERLLVQQVAQSVQEQAH
jgi:hypothetical protein